MKMKSRDMSMFFYKEKARKAVYDHSVVMVMSRLSQCSHAWHIVGEY